MSFLLGFRELMLQAAQGRSDRARKDLLPEASESLHKRRVGLLGLRDGLGAQNAKLDSTIGAVNQVEQVAPNLALMSLAAQAAVDTAEADVQTAEDDLSQAQAFEWQLWRNADEDRAALAQVNNARAARDGAVEVAQAVDSGRNPHDVLSQQVDAVAAAQDALKAAEAGASIAILQVAGLEKIVAGDGSPAAAAGPETFRDVPYGTALFEATVDGEALVMGQNANVHIPGAEVTPLGCILWFPGGAWAFANKDAEENDSACAELAEAGYVVINANYRQATDGTGPGPYVGQGGYYDNGTNDGIFDAMRILRYLISPDVGDAQEAAGVSSVWTNVRALVEAHGLMVAGVSAGGFMTMHSTLRYGAASGNWPRAAFNFAGPADVTYNWGTPTDDQRAVTVNYFRNYGAEGSPGFEAAQEQASMQYSFGVYSAAFAASDMEFHFMRNANDTIVTTAMLSPLIEQVRTVAPTRTHEYVISEFWPPGATTAWPTNHNLSRTQDQYILRAAGKVF